ncbi:hypothetical protein [Streptomyces sp. NPDC003077]|uniref:hypothetical protein n=1 Tax=Streptomyces sp. NPDC003077 TaxID=3154443 RepID=UPI0033BE78E9
MPHTESAPAVRKSRSQAVLDNLFGSTALFMAASVVCFTLVTKKYPEAGHEWGWISYAGGFVPPVIAGLWCAVARRRPGTGAAVAAVLLAVFGVLHWFTQA